MSLENLNLALFKAKKLDYYKIKGESPNEVIDRAEKLLDLKLSKQHRVFYSKVGYLSAFGIEFFGICKNDFSGKTDICAVETTLKERELFNLPKKWVLLYFFDDGYYGYLDYSKLNSDGEPSVIMVSNQSGEYKVIDKVSDDLGDFILNTIDGVL